MAITTQPAPGRASIEVPNPAREAIYLQISSDALLFLGLAGWLIWDKGIRPAIARRLSQAMVPIEEERRLTNILAQIGIITRADRVILAAFHNGALDAAGYHLQKLSTVNTYTAPGALPMPAAIRGLPIGRIMTEIEQMIQAGTWVAIEYGDDLPQPCRDHLLRNDIRRMYSRLIKVGDLPIGVLSLHYSRSTALFHPARRRSDAGVIPEEHERLMNDLYEEIALVMRRRIIHPSPVHRILGTLIGTLNLGRKGQG